MTSPRSKRNQLNAYMLLMPSMVTLILIVFFPILYVAFLSFSGFTYGQRTGFIGLRNYLYIFTDPLFFTSLKATVIFTFWSVIGQATLAIIFATAINAAGKGESGIRLAVIMPYMVSMVAGGVTFRWMLNTEFGIVNYLLLSMKIVDNPVNFLGIPSLAMASIVIAHLWSSTPFATLILLAGLKSISTEIYESAEIDGAGFFRKFFSITIPLIKPQILIVMLIQTMFAFREFALPFSMTGGGPGVTTKLLAMLLKEKMTYLDFGYNSALSVIMMVITLLVALVYLKMMAEPAARNEGS
ncbi:MAG: sugar ABC transporter permease [Rectinemataceae bacterium]